MFANAKRQITQEPVTCLHPSANQKSRVGWKWKRKNASAFSLFFILISLIFRSHFFFFFVVYVQVGISTLSFLKGRGGIHRPEIISAKHHTMYIHSFHRHIMSVYIRIITKLLSVRSCHNPELDRQTIDFVNFKIQARLSKIYLIASSEDVCLYWSRENVRIYLADNL